MALHKIKSEGRHMNGGWVHMIPDLRGIEDLATKHAKVVMMIVFDRDSQRFPKKRRYIQDGGISNKNLDIILKAMGLGISQSGRSKSVWVDLENRYLKLRENNPSMIGPTEPISRTGKRYENAKSENGKRQTVTQPSLELVFDNAKSENGKRYENARGFIHTERFKKEKNMSQDATCDDLKNVFDELWKIYPGYRSSAGRQVKGVKSKALEKFLKVAQKEPGAVAQIEAAIKTLASEYEHDPNGFTFQPALEVWLNKRKWEEFDAPAQGINPADLPHDLNCNLKGVLVINGQPRGFCSHCKARRHAR